MSHAAAAAMAARAAYSAHKSKSISMYAEANPWVESYLTEARRAGIGPPEEKEPNDEKEPAPRTNVMAMADPPTWFDNMCLFIRTKIVQRRAFDNFIILVIVLCGVSVGVDVAYLHQEDSEPAWCLGFNDTITYFSLVVFTIECVFKILAQGRNPKMYFLHPQEGNYNSFDFLVVTLSYVFITDESVSTIAIMRLIRLIRVMNMFEEIRVIIKGLFVGLKSVSNISMLLVLILYIYAIVGVMLFGGEKGNDPVHFANVKIAMVTLFRCTTLASWNEVYNINFYGCDRYTSAKYMPATELTWFKTGYGRFPNWDCSHPENHPVTSSFYCFTFTFLTAFVIISLFVGVITMGMFETLDEKAGEEREEEYATNLEKNLEELDPNHNEELRLALDSIFARAEAAEGGADGGGGGDGGGGARLAAYRALAERCRQLSESKAFMTLIVLAIVIVAISVGVQTDHGESMLLTHVIDNVILFIFCLECVVKIVAEGEQPLRYFYHPDRGADRWNCFDFAIVLLSFVELGHDLGGLAVLRLVRLIKLARSFPSLRLIVEALLEALSGVFYVLILLLAINYVVCILGVIMFGENDPQHWGTLQRAFMTVWLCETFDEWEEVLYINMYGCNEFGYDDHDGVPALAMRCDQDHAQGHGWLAFLFFVIVVTLTGFVMPTVMIGVISISFDASKKRVEEERELALMVSKVQERCQAFSEGVDLAKRTEKLKQIFDKLDADGQGSLDIHELKPFIEFFVLEYVGIHDVEIDPIFYALDLDNSSDINFAEFLWFMLSFRHFRLTTPAAVAKPAAEKADVSDASDASELELEFDSAQPSADGVEGKHAENGEDGDVLVEVTWQDDAHDEQYADRMRKLATARAKLAEKLGRIDREMEKLNARASHPLECVKPGLLVPIELCNAEVADDDRQPEL